MSLLFVVCFSFAVLLQSPTKWYMKLVPVSQLTSAMLFHLCIHSDRLVTVTPSSLPPPSVLIAIHFIARVHQPVTSLLRKHSSSSSSPFWINKCSLVLHPCDLLYSGKQRRVEFLLM